MNFNELFEEFIIYFTDPQFLSTFYETWAWLIFLFPVIKMAKVALYHYRVALDRHTWKWVLLAIDVPKDNEQSPKALEHLFSHLAGAHSTMDIKEIHWDGITQKWFSFEIVSIEGYIQFLIYTEVAFRPLVEAAIYGQYTDAEITEVEDYTKGIPTIYPNDTHDVWGSDFKQVNPQWFPIRSYREFEDMRTGNFLDPMSALLETMSRMGPGEQLWFQLLVKPIGVDWKVQGKELVKKLAGIPAAQHKNALSGILDAPGKVVSGIADEIFNTEAGHMTEKKHEIPSRMLYLTPGERGTVEALEKKMAKIGFSCKIRVLYVATKESFKKSNAVQAIVGAIKQFNTEDLNAIIPDMRKTAVTAHYIMVERRKNWRKSRLVNWYKRRSIWGGTPEYVLNTEELATLWHFPVLARAPSLKQTRIRKSDAPMSVSQHR